MSKSDADLLREILVFIHIPAQQAALERAIKAADERSKQTSVLVRVQAEMDAERGYPYAYDIKPLGGFWD